MGLVLHLILYSIVQSLIEIGSLIGILVFFGLVLGMIERVANRQLIATFGRKGVLVTAWIGTPVHELNHAVMCLIFGHKIIEIKLLQLRSSDGTLGYVSHAYNKRSFYQSAGNLFIGIAPIVGGVMVIVLLMHILVPEGFVPISQVFQNNVPDHAHFFSITLPAIGVMVKALFTLQHLFSLSFWCFLFLGMSISSHIALSKEDIRGARSGLLAVSISFVIVNAVATLLLGGKGNDMMLMLVDACRYYLLVMVSLVLVFSLLKLGLSSLVFFTKRLFIARRRQQESPPFS
ncbi:hypothetical protein JOD43_003127 [Pullulanibacillus pueri]|uniref:hypothetical protein n=1 Tax=Pullulanibacillus pueri TaxID=1437324 RepID=UPI0016655967|nr:hypothetical protein [Pullulanibacillus pueri]MBM7682948.1 hypothetical protein [Pullulanibacillus pueri]